jgi:dGTPase
VNAEYELSLGEWPSLEAQIAAVADDIAYDNHDIDDGIRAGLLTIQQLCALPFVADRWAMILQRYPDHTPDRLVPELIREQIGVMVNDVIEATQVRIADSGVQSVADVRAAGFMIGGFSEEMLMRERQLKRFMYDNLYHHPTQVEAAEDARRIIIDLYAAYTSNVDLLPAEWLSNLPGYEPDRSRHIADFLAGMTDRYAQNSHRQIFGVE